MHNSTMRSGLSCLAHHVGFRHSISSNSRQSGRLQCICSSKARLTGLPGVRLLALPAQPVFIRVRHCVGLLPGPRTLHLRLRQRCLHFRGGMPSCSWLPFTYSLHSTCPTWLERDLMLPWAASCAGTCSTHACECLAFQPCDLCCILPHPPSSSGTSGLNLAVDLLSAGF